jgi:hypothetical protein
MWRGGRVVGHECCRRAALRATVRAALEPMRFGASTPGPRRYGHARPASAGRSDKAAKPAYLPPPAGRNVSLPLGEQTRSLVPGTGRSRRSERVCVYYTLLAWPDVVTTLSHAGCSNTLRRVCHH